MNIIWSDLALGDLHTIKEYITKDNAVVALQVVITIISIVENQLSVFPRSGRTGRVPSTYVLAIAKLPYVVLYRITKENIEVARVYHTSRQRPENFS